MTTIVVVISGRAKKRKEKKIVINRQWCLRATHKQAHRVCPQPPKKKNKNKNKNKERIAIDMLPPLPFPPIYYLMALVCVSKSYSRPCASSITPGTGSVGKAWPRRSRRWPRGCFTRVSPVQQQQQRTRSSPPATLDRRQATNYPTLLSPSHRSSTAGRTQTRRF